MSLRSLPFWTLFLAAPGFFLGCGSPTASPSTSGAGRPQVMVASDRANEFVGDWGPGPEYLANDWLVRFTPDGKLSVKGPGMTARGTYVASGNLASAAYAVRDGGRASASQMHGEFSLSPERDELTFSTGLPNDAPVHLVRVQAHSK